jgi:hypothetical protein
MARVVIEGGLSKAAAAREKRQLAALIEAAQAERD